MGQKRHLLINWTDGVKINKDHFIESDFHHADMMRDYATTHLTSYNYGLLESEGDTKEAVGLVINTNTQERFSLRLVHCNAITKKGCRILFNKQLYGDDGPTAAVSSSDVEESSNSEFYVLLTVNPFRLVPVGEPDPENIPLHHPYALPKIGLHIVPQSHFNLQFMDKHYLIVSKVLWKNGAFSVDEKYVPPVTKIKHHATLRSFHKKVCDIMIRLKNYSIIINNKNRHKFQNNKLAGNTFKLCARVMRYVSDHIFTYTQMGEENPPIFLAQSISLLGNYISTELAILQEEDREKLLQYYYEWIDIKPSVFESTIGDVINLNYDHSDITTTLNKLDYFMTVLERLWKKMSDLEYIGVRKDNIVISEDVTTQRTEKKDSSWSIID